MTTFLCYMLLKMPYKIFLFYKSTTKINGEILDFYAESDARRCRTWHPVIQYYTPENEKVVFIPDSTLMFQPKKHAKISIRILNDNHLVAERFTLHSGFLVVAAITAGFATILIRSFRYAAMGEYATAPSRNIVIGCILACTLCCLLLPLFQKIISAVFSLHKAIIVDFKPVRNKSGIITHYHALAKISQQNDHKPVDIGSSPVISIASCVFVYCDKKSKRYKPVQFAVFIFSSLVLFTFAVVFLFKYADFIL